MKGNRDRILQAALQEIAVTEGELWERERLKLDRPSAEQRVAFITVLDQELAGQKQQKKAHFRQMGKVVAAVAVVAISLGVVTWNADAIRAKWFGIDLHDQIDHSQVGAEQLLEEAQINPTDESFNLPTDIRRGYAVEQVDEKTKTVYYKDKDGKYIRFNILSLEKGYTLDNEDVYVEQIKVNYFDAIYVEKGELKQLVWTDDSVIYALETDGVSKEQLIKMAESVALTKNI